MQDGSDDEIDLTYDDEEGNDDENEFSPVRINSGGRSRNKI